MKRKITIFGFLISILMLSGCLGKDAEIYDENDVLDYVDSICREPYELVGKTLIGQEPDHMEYRFQTKKRSLEFTADSYLSPIRFDASVTSFYRREISCDYVSAVHDQYLEEVDSVLQECDRYLASGSLESLYVIDFKDIDKIVDVILKADRVYQQESAYNSDEFLSEYPIKTIPLVWNRTKEEALEGKRWVHITNIKVTGQNEKETLYENLAGNYAQLYLDGKIEEGVSILQKYLENKHKSLLSVIELGGEEMFYDNDDTNPYGRFGLTTDDYKYCWYNQEKESYMMAADIGWITESASFPMINREYVNALGGNYQVEKQKDQYISSWEIDGDIWIMESRYSDGEIRSFEVKKNGKPLEISYITAEEDHKVKATFCVGIPVEDFCRLFDLSYVVEEENGKIIFSRGK